MPLLVCLASEQFLLDGKRVCELLQLLLGVLVIGGSQLLLSLRAGGRTLLDAGVRTLLLHAGGPLFVAGGGCGHLLGAGEGGVL